MRGIKYCLRLTTLLLSMLAFVLTGCGGGGGGSSSSSSTSDSTSALTVAEKVSVVEAQDSGSSGVAPMKIGVFKLSPSDLPADSDYFKDETFVFVEERSTEAFDLVNEILCMMAQTKYDEMLNKGDYKAQIDSKQCNSSNDSTSTAGQQSQNQTSGSTAPNYEMWIVNSSRADNNSPQIVKVWIHEAAEEFEPEKMIFVKTVITEGVSASNPYGLFTLNFKAHPIVNGQVDTSTVMFKGFLKTEEDSATGKILLKFVIDGGFSTPNGDISFAQKVTLDRSANGSSGSGTIYSLESFPGPGGTQTDESKFNIAFNSNYFLREDALNNNQICLSRTSFDETVWRYGLYDSQGNRVVRNSGFPIKTTQNGKDYYGWIGYWGLWFPEDVTLQNGDTVYKLSFGPGGETGTPYTVFISGGKLVKHSRKTLQLGDIKNVPLDWWDSGTPYRVVWDGAQFKKIAVVTDTSNWTWTDISSQGQTIDLTALQWTDLNFWSPALGGSVRVRLEDPANSIFCNYDQQNGTFDCSQNASDLREVVIYSEDIVYPTDTIPTQLACLDQCPDPAALTGQNPYHDTSTYQFQNVPPSQAQYISYTFDSSNMVLQENGQNVVLSTENQNYEWGIMSGPLFEPNQTNLNALACDWDPNSTCGWQAWSELDVFYTWETGPNDWNKFTALKDSNNNFLTFDPPLQVEYIHNWGNGTTSKFYLEYSGFGELHGIPGTCVDWDTGEEESCDATSRWVPDFNIPDGSEVTSGNNSYLVKALEKEQRMRLSNPNDSSDITACTSAGLSTVDYTNQLPDINDWEDPNIGSAPTVTGPPAVIGGVVQ